jgi:thioredoxin 1
MLMPVITLTEKNFDKEVKQSRLPVLVSCQDSGSVVCVENISERMKNVLKCCRINVGANPGLARRYRVRCLPTILVFKAGVVTDTIVGETRTEQLIRILQ